MSDILTTNRRPSNGRSSLISKPELDGSQSSRDKVASKLGLGGGVTLAAIARLGSLILGIAFQIAVAKALSADEYASYAIAFALGAVVATLCGFGISRTLPRFIPLIIAYGTTSDLRRTAAGYVAFKLAVLTLVTGALWKFYQLYAPALWNSEPPSISIFISWVIILSLQSDIEAMAQSLMEYRIWAVTSLLELLGRVFISIYIARSGSLTPDTVLLIWAITASVQFTVVVLFLFLRKRENGSASSSDVAHQLLPSFGQQFTYAISLYVSALAWLVSSPLAIRLVSATGLAAPPLAAISFVQTLVMSASRALPVLLLSAVIEPLLVSKGIVQGDRRGVGIALSILIKLETVAILTAIVTIQPCNEFIVALLGKSEFAIFGFVFSILLLQALGASYYRLMEIQAGISQLNSAFIIMLPISVTCLLLVYATSESLDFLALLIWPSVDVIAKIAIMAYLLRARGLTSFFDATRLCLLAISALALICVSEFVIWYLALDGFESLAMSLAGGLAFIGGLFLLKPIRREEHAFLIEVLKSQNGWIDRIGRRLVR
jgi:hypothetical protein